MCEEIDTDGEEPYDPYARQTDDQIPQPLKRFTGRSRKMLIDPKFMSLHQADRQDDIVEGQCYGEKVFNGGYRTQRASRSSVCWCTARSRGNEGNGVDDDENKSRNEV